MVAFVSFSFTSCAQISRNSVRYGRIALLAYRCSFKRQSTNVGQSYQTIEQTVSPDCEFSRSVWNGRRGAESRDVRSYLLNLSQ